MQTATIQLDELSSRFNLTQEPLLRARHLPGRVYSSPEIYAMEKERIFMTHWLSVGRVEEIPTPGDYMTFSVMDEPIIISRTEDGQVSVCMNMCLHRGVAVASGCGHAKDFSCPYHAWLFDVGGKLISAPGMKASEVDLKEARLKPLPVKIWRGWIFTNFSENPASFEDFIAP
jgi:Rieske 2Fe-2S family protein